jgi:NhaP-type Na+/H+ or K+/H+ antiporter
VSWALPTIALALLAFAAVSARLDGTPLTAPMVFTAVGLLVGTDALGLVDPGLSGEPVKLLAEATLALVLFGDASRIDLRALRDEVSLPARLLGIGLPLTILAGFVAALLVFGSLSWPEALLIAIVLAPTDAALGQAVVTSERLPLRVRQGLNVESGLNDGICVPLFFVAIAIAKADEGRVSDLSALRLVAEEIGYGSLCGIGVGVVGAVVIVEFGRRGWVAHQWAQVVARASSRRSSAAPCSAGSAAGAAARSATSSRSSEASSTRRRSSSSERSCSGPRSGTRRGRSRCTPSCR